MTNNREVKHNLYVSEMRDISANNIFAAFGRTAPKSS